MLFVSGFGSVYLLVSAISLAAGMAAAINANKISRCWNKSLSHEERYELEKRVYLVITLMGLGLALRFFLVPLWFITLTRLMPTIPGAMCLTAVHLASPLSGFSATALKFDGLVKSRRLELHGDGSIFTKSVQCKRFFY